MNSGMRQIVGAAALTALIWSSNTPAISPALAQDPDWLRDRQFQIAPPYRQWDPVRREPRPAWPRGQQPGVPQVRARPEPASQSAERATCLNKQMPPDAVIAACTTVTTTAQDKSETLATFYLHRD